MKKVHVKITTFEEMLGTASANEHIHEEYIASKAETEEKYNEELDAIRDPEAEFEKAMTVFPRKDGKPIMWDYQIKGMFKDSCSALQRVPGSESKKLKAYKKVIDGLMFPQPRAILIETDEPITICQRPLRAMTAQGERIALASSEAIAPGAKIEFDVLMLTDDLTPVLKEWLDYGELRGLGQWRNSGKGRYTYEMTEV